MFKKSVLIFKKIKPVRPKLIKREFYQNKRRLHRYSLYSTYVKKIKYRCIHLVFDICFRYFSILILTQTQLLREQEINNLPIFL